MKKDLAILPKALKCVYVRRIGIKSRKEHKNLEKKKMKMKKKMTNE
ncbi:hypothetical protein RDABS01_038693 [Bienertia sinuspersici]